MVGGTVEYWLNIAQYDIETAKSLLTSKRYLYVGFLCHLTVEKALKAVIARDCAENEIPPKIHNLINLAQKANLYDSLTDVQKLILRKLNPLNIEARYPEYKDEIEEALTHEKCETLIKEAEGMLCWIKQQL